MNIAIIPARGGSKRIPRKNITRFCGKPIIAYSIEAAINSKLIDRVIVSTDDYEIANVAKEYGAEIPFMRDKSLADDMTGTTPVIRSALSDYIALKNNVEYCLCLYATAPFVTAQLLDQSLELLQQTKADYVFTAHRFSFPIQRALLEDEIGNIRPCSAVDMNKRSQDLPHAYHDAGQLYAAQASTWLDTSKAIFSERSRMLKLPSHLVQDIDTFEDWKRAEVMFRVLKEMGERKS